MKIAFWSNGTDTCSVTANMAAMSVACVLRFPYQVIALENHLNRINLGLAYDGKSKVGLLREVGTNYYEGGGMEGLIRKINRGIKDVEQIRPYLKEVICNHLLYIPQSNVINKDIFNIEFLQNYETLFEYLAIFADLFLIDVENTNNISTQHILDQADLVVVNLPQNPKYLEDFFLNYSSILSKTFFVISKYSNHSIYNGKKLSQMFGIPKEQFAAIPYNELFYEAFQNGSLVEFITANYHCDNTNPNFYFIQMLKKATYLIVKNAKQNRLQSKGRYQCGN